MVSSYEANAVIPAKLLGEIEFGPESGGRVAPIVGRRPERDYIYSRSLAVLSEPGSARAESIGALRTHLLAQHVRDGRRSLAICAPAVGVGSTYVATNLTVALSLAGVKTLLIDANMRSPGIDGVICPIEPGPGLQQCLSDDPPPLGDAIRENVLPNLSILYAGGVAANAQELLASGNFRALIDTCMRDFDLTVIDTPPSNSCADARRVANVLRYALIIARRNATFVSDVRMLAQELQSDRAVVIGTFLNDI